jgi:hypothetical protein
MSVTVSVHDLQSTKGFLEGEIVNAVPLQIAFNFDDASSGSLKPDFKSTNNGNWSCMFDALEFKIDTQRDVVVKVELMDNNGQKNTVSGMISSKDLLVGFQNFIIPLYIQKGDSPQFQLMLSASPSSSSATDNSGVFRCFSDLESDAIIDDEELSTVWKRYAIRSDGERYLDTENMTSLVEDMLTATRNRWIHRFQPSRVDRVFDFVHTRITPAELAMIFVKQLDLDGDGKVQWSEFKERFHQSVRMFLKRAETDILNEPSKGEQSDDQHSELEHFFERELRDSIQCRIL